MSSVIGDFPLENLDIDLSALGGDPFELPEYEPDVTFGTPRSRVSRYSRFSRAPSLAPSRAESIARAVQEDDSEGPPLAIFDGGESSVGSQFTGKGDTGGFSKTTGMAMGVLRREIEAIGETLEGEGEAKGGVTFAKVARGASKRAASHFFFELLVLGTRDAVGLKQDKPYGEIEVTGRPGLWTRAAEEGLGAEAEVSVQAEASAPVSEV
jgi:cohesin complex subunit SCC1